MTNQPDTPAYILDVLWAGISGSWDGDGDYPSDEVLEKYFIPEDALKAINSYYVHLVLEAVDVALPIHVDEYFRVREALVSAFATVSADSEKCNIDPEKTSD